MLNRWRHHRRQFEPHSRSGEATDWLTGEAAQAVLTQLATVLDPQRPVSERMAALHEQRVAQVVRSAGCFVDAVAFVLEGGAPPPALAGLAAPPPPGSAFVLFAPDPEQWITRAPTNHIHIAHQEDMP